MVDIASGRIFVETYIEKFMKFMERLVENFSNNGRNNRVFLKMVGIQHLNEEVSLM